MNSITLTYEHGDTLIFLASADLSGLELDGLRDTLQRKFPAADVLVLAGITDVKVVKRND